jgi:transcriptional regulator with XRE-family HTH domain
LRTDRVYRRAFFLAESSSLIARQLIELRKRRGLNQAQVAVALETGQPAICRVERADYRNWSFNTLRRLADALDARLRVIIEPSEDILSEYEGSKKEKGLIDTASPAPGLGNLRETNPYLAPPVRPRRITENTDSAASFDAPIEQRPQRSLLDERKIGETMPRQRVDQKETAGATWS